MSAKLLSLVAGLVYLWFIHTLWGSEPAFINPFVAIITVISTALVTVVLVIRMSGPSG